MIRQSSIKALVFAAFVAFAPMATAQVSGGVTATGTINPGDIAVFNKKTQIKSGSGTPVSGQCYIYTGTYPSGTWGPGSCSGGASGPASVQITSPASTITISPAIACATGACAFTADLPSIITAAGPVGDATHVPQITYDARGRLMAVASIAITQPLAANPSATAGPSANNGVATTFMRSDATPAVQQGSATQKGIVQADGTTITASAGVFSAVQQAVPSPASPSATAGPTANNGVATTYMRSDASPAVRLGSATQVGLAQADGTTITATGGVFSAVFNAIVNATCTVTQSTCNTIFGYYNPIWFGAKCDGSTDDTTAIRSTIAAANNGTMRFPAGLTCLVSGPIRICIATTCADGGGGGNVPHLVDFNKSTLKATGSAFAYILYVENLNSSSYIYMRVANGNIAGNSIATNPLYVGGCGHCIFENMDVTTGTGIGCVFAGWPLHGFYYTHVLSVTCESNGGIGLAEYVYSGGTGNNGPFGGGTLGCVSGVSYNNANSFTNVSVISNGGRGVDVNCAHNAHYGEDVEANGGSGIVFANISSGTSDWFGGYTEGNSTPTDTSVFNSDNSGGINFYGGYHLGAFSSANAANNDMILVRGVSGFGFSSSCSTHLCINVP